MFVRDITQPLSQVPFFMALLFDAAACAPARTLLPQEKVPADWQPRLPHDGATDELLGWWDMFDDESLRALLTIAKRENATVAAAKISFARATCGSQKSALLPSADVSASLTRSVTDTDTDTDTDTEGMNRVPGSTTGSGPRDANREVDIAGKARDQAKAADASVSTSVDDWHEACISLSAEVADYYVRYRACRQLGATYREELASQKATIEAITLSASTGRKSTSDPSFVRASAASSSSSLRALEAEWNLIVKSLKEITGRDEVRRHELLGKGRKSIPTPHRFKVASVPADLLRQLPDLRCARWNGRLSRKPMNSPRRRPISIQASRYPAPSASTATVSPVPSALRCCCRCSMVACSERPSGLPRRNWMRASPTTAQAYYPRSVRWNGSRAPEQHTSTPGRGRRRGQGVQSQFQVGG